MNTGSSEPGSGAGGASDPLVCTPGREKTADQVVNYLVGGFVFLAGMAMVVSILSKQGDPAELVALVIALPLVGFGSYLLFFRSKILLDPSQGLIRKVRLAGPIRYAEKRYPLSEAVGVRVRKKLIRSRSDISNSNWTRYLVQVVFFDGRVIDLSTSSDDLEVSRRNAYRWADHCGLPVDPRPEAEEDDFSDAQ